jgi:hypothetical protein
MVVPGDFPARHPSDHKIRVSRRAIPVDVVPSSEEAERRVRRVRASNSLNPIRKRPGIIIHKRDNLRVACADCGFEGQSQPWSVNDDDADTCTHGNVLSGPVRGLSDHEDVIGSVYLDAQGSDAFLEIIRATNAGDSNGHRRI